MEGTSPGNVYNVTKSEPGRSFIKIDGKWVDTTTNDIKEKLGIEFMPGDVCIPVLYKI